MQDSDENSSQISLEKFDNSINVFSTISKILDQTVNEDVKFVLLGFISPLLGSWSKGHHLL